jgi:hypothetical protein
MQSASAKARRARAAVARWDELPPELLARILVAGGEDSATLQIHGDHARNAYLPWLCAIGAHELAMASQVCKAWQAVVTEVAQRRRCLWIIYVRTAAPREPADVAAFKLWLEQSALLASERKMGGARLIERLQAVEEQAVLQLKRAPIAIHSQCPRASSCSLDPMAVRQLLMQHIRKCMHAACPTCQKLRMRVRVHRHTMLQRQHLQQTLLLY